MKRQSIYLPILVLIFAGALSVCCAAVADAAKRGWSAYNQSVGQPPLSSVKRIIYVDAHSAGTSDGSSWANAYNYLQDALAGANTAEKPVEIRVAQGTYKPDRGVNQTPGDRSATFQLINGVAVKGGYAGAGEPDPDAKDIALYTTIMSGDLAGNDADVNDPAALEDEPSRADNSYHVVTGSGTDETAVLDGFSIVAGNVRGADSWDGAGMYNMSGSPTVANCTFYGNAAGFGGAMYNLDSDPNLTNCDFVKNYGGMYNDNSSPKIVNCAFNNNVASHMGGGGVLNTWYSSPTFTNCVFSQNRAGDSGAVYNSTESKATLINCTFTGNTATLANGGAIYNNGSIATLIGCTFTANTTSDRMGRGGAIYSDWWSNLTAKNCTFTGNQASKDGGAIYNGMSDLTLSNCTFTQNRISPAGGPTAFAWGGAICNGSDSPIVLTDCIFVENVAGSGGGMCNYPGGNLTLKGCSFLNNSGNSGGALDISHCYATLVGCSFSGNFATNSGGAIYSDLPKSLKLANCLFTANKARQGGALYMYGARDTTAANCTFAANVAGTGSTLACGDWPSIFEFTNCILWDGPDPIWKYGDVSNGPGPLPAESNISVTYSNVQGSWPGEGNINVDPYFADPGYWADTGDPNVMVEPGVPDAVWVDGDYHLKSQAGRWDPTSASWVRDDVTSLCIDAGHVNSPIGFEPFPNGGRINMGAYGGTTQASKSYFGEPVCQTIIAGDINGDCRIDLLDFAIMCSHWLQHGTDFVNVPPTVIITEPTDGAIIGIYSPDTPIIIRADASDPDGSVVEVQFRIKHASRHRIRRTSRTGQNVAGAWQLEWFWWDEQNPYPEGDFTITAIAMDDEGAVSVSPEIVITVHGPK
jgi:predicted outer membrane repeat protein